MKNPATQACLALHRLPGLSKKDLYRLLSVVEPEDCLTLDTSQMLSLEISEKGRQALQGSISTQATGLCEQDWQRMQSLQIELISVRCPQYPALLQEITDPPPLLYVRGKSALLNRPQLAIVGSRRSSAPGRANAYRFSKALAEAGFTITSGLALGIDAQAHRAALDVAGDTVAVLGTGVDVIYPVSNRVLFHQLLTHGTIISEFPLRTTARPSHFPVRNRIISGMSLGVLVAEAALKSGSLITARCALEQNREVFALPGSIHDLAHRGCHQLIRTGAKLVESTADIMAELRGWQAADTAITASPVLNKPVLNKQEQLVIEAMGFAPVSVDLLQQRCHLSMPTLLVHLTTLELKGLLANQGGCYQRLC